MVKQIKNKYFGKKAMMSYSQISLLVLAIVSMSFMIGMMDRVNAGGLGALGIGGGTAASTQTVGGASYVGGYTAGAGAVAGTATAGTYTLTGAGLSSASAALPAVAAGGTPIAGGTLVVGPTGAGTITLTSGTGTTLYTGSVTAETATTILGQGTGGTSWLSNTISKNILNKPMLTGGFADALWSGVQWAALAYGAGYLIGSLLGWSDDNTQALATGMAVAFGVGRFLNVYTNLPGAANFLHAGLGGFAPWVIGIAIGFAIFAYMYEDQKQEIVEFQCLPWQAPDGGANCEKCNNDLKPCTEYRCRSLGQLCELENKGTDHELCLAVNIRETDPPVIKPNTYELSSGFKYIYPDQQVSPPSHGFKIVPEAGVNQCIKPYTPINFGISTFYSDGVPAPSRCRIDIKHTTSFDNMSYWFGGDNLYAYNHSESLVLPNTKDLANSSLILENGKTMVFYIRCEGKNDKNNVNPAEYMLRICIDPSPDSTAPQIKATSLLNESCIGENKNNAMVDFYVNEPSECKWSHEDRNFDQMENNLACPNSARDINSILLYTCIANLTGIKREKTDFYVRCKDQPELKGKNESLRNPMSQAYKYTLRSSDGLRINKVTPSGNVYSGATPATINFNVETSSGCNDGKATCYYSLTGNANNYIEFLETNTVDGIHSQTIYAGSGRQTYYIKCIDEGGNIAINTTEVNVQVLTGGPIIARAYVSNEANKLKIATLRKSECAYSFENCDFTFKQGVEMPIANETIHYADLRMDKTYYIKCRDEYSSEPVGCSIILKPQLLV